MIMGNLMKRVKGPKKSSLGGFYWFMTVMLIRLLRGSLGSLGL